MGKGKAVPLALSAVSGILGGIGATQDKTGKSTIDKTTTEEALLGRKQNRINTQLFHTIMDALQLGPQVSQSDRNMARANINTAYQGAQRNLDAALASRGFGQSGKVGAGVRDLNLGRMKEFQTTEGRLRDEAQQRFQQMIQNAFQFDIPRTTTSHTTGTESVTVPGASPFSAAGSGFGDLASFLWMQRLFGGGGGGGFGSSGPGGYGFPGDPSICWIAEELYGAADWRVVLIQRWLLWQSKQFILWSLFVQAYRMFGKITARLMRWNLIPQAAIRKAFDAMVLRAMNA